MNYFSTYALKITFSLSLLLLYACEYQNDEMNYHTLIPPEEEINITYNLADIPEGETIYIYAPTSLSYMLNTSAGEIISTEFYLNNQPINHSESKIFLTPDDIPKNTTSKLKLNITLTSGTGSLAEILGGEKKNFEFYYPIKYVSPDIKLNIKQRISNDKHLELYWEKPQLEGTDVASYSIFYYDNGEEIFVEEISDPDITSYTDRNYVYGSKTFKIVTTYQSEQITPKEDFYTVKYNEFTSNMFSTGSSESFKLRIKWNNPNDILCKYVLKWKDEVVYIPVNESEGLVSRPVFPMSDTQYYEIYILPVDAPFEDYATYSGIINYFEESFFGETYEPYAGNIWFAADIKHDYILAMRPSRDSFGFRAYDKDNLNVIQNTGFGNIYPFYTSEFTTAPTSGKVAIHYRHNNSSDIAIIHVYADYTLKKWLGSFNTDAFPVFFLTDDDKIIINNNDRRTNRIYDVNTGSLLNNQIEDTKTDFRPVISADGKYIFNYLRLNDAWYKLYHYENGNFDLITYQTNSRVKNIVFNPKTPEHVIMQSMDNYFSVFEVPSLNKIATIEGEFICFDPFTGNILYSDKNFEENAQLNILNHSYDKTIFKIIINPIYYNYYFRLMNNHLIIYDYYINIIK
ncbi:MAG: hypothetical protein LUG18_05035 [Candidatus Azobacteroides sp.]|nr:hypothetical protein [Candidatus Azobacteroides sp.]